MPKLTTLVLDDHRYTERLIGELTADVGAVTYDDTARKNLADYLVVSSSRHEAAEELVVWPAVRKRVPGGEALLAEGLRQERDAKYALDALRFADGPSRQQLAAEFAQMARAHIDFEEHQVLPALEKVTLWPGLYLLGAKFSAAKRIAPTRPHPKGPVGHVGLLTKGVVTAAMDRVRDKATGRDTVGTG
jgi:hypothetical protein